MQKRFVYFIGVLAAIVFVPQVCAAQDGGIKGGVTLASLPISLPSGEIYTGRLHVGAAGGGFVVFPVSKTVVLQTEAVFTVKGTRDPNEHVNLTYLDVPVLVRLVSAQYGHAMLHAYVGPSFAVKLSASDNLSDLSRTVFGGAVDDHTKSFDPGLTVGGDVFGKHVIGDFRYTWGFTDIRNLTTKSGTVKNRALTVMIGYRFGK